VTIPELRTSVYTHNPDRLISAHLIKTSESQYKSFYSIFCFLILRTFIFKKNYLFKAAAIDLFVVGSVAVSMDGTRLGKGILATYLKDFFSLFFGIQLSQ